MTQLQAFTGDGLQAFEADTVRLEARQKTQPVFVCVKRILASRRFTYVDAYRHDSSGFYYFLWDLSAYSGPGIVSPVPYQANLIFYRQIITYSYPSLPTYDPSPPWQNWAWNFGSVATDGSLTGLRNPYWVMLQPEIITWDLQLGCPDPGDPRYINWPGTVATRTRWY